MTLIGLKIAHITLDGKEIDEETDIKAAADLTQKSSDVLEMYTKKTPMFIKFYATWCGHCKTNDVFWKELVKKAREEPAIKNANIAIVEVESKIMNKDINKIIETEGLKEVRGFPTIGMITYPGGKAKFTSYDGDRKTGPMFAAVKELATGKQSGGAKLSGGAKRKVTRKHRKTTYRKSMKSKRSGSKRSGSKRSGSKRSGSKRSGSKNRRIKRN
jgi:thiol-disulfide isomerase/thioredoxin